MKKKRLGIDGLSYLIDKIKSSLEKKVDKEEGKTLSSNDFTTAEKTKLAGIENGAEVNVQSDWSQNDESADDYIKGRTHWVETVEGVIEFNGDLTDREYLPFNETTFGVKVSDKVLTESDLIGSTLCLSSGGGIVVTADMVMHDNGSVGVVLMGVPFVATVPDEWNGFSKGTYFVYYTEKIYTDDENYYVEEMYTRSISCLTWENTIVKTIDEKFIPDSIARTAVIGFSADESDM